MKNIKTYESFFRNETFKEWLGNDCNFSKIKLICNDENLIDLNGIEKFTKLKEFYCYKNEIKSLKPIKNLIELKLLTAGYNMLTNLDDITNLINLTYLNFNGNKITSLKGIENLINLEELYCRDNPIDWIDYIDKKGNTWYTQLPKSIKWFTSDKFRNIKDYWEWFEENQPVEISRKFNF